MASNYLQTAEGKIADRYRTATALKYVGKYEEALRHYKAILKQDEHHFLALYNVGSCELYLGNLSESQRAYDDLLRLLVHTNWTDNEEQVRIYHGALMQLYCIAEKQTEFDKGERHLLRSLEVRPDDALSYLNLVICCLKAGKYSEANKWYDILMNHPDRVSALSDLEPEDQTLIDNIKKLKKEDRSEVKS
jgi:tetratricopeptide (TPR) repeat protein